MRLYLSGPMTGHPDFNYPAFMDAAARLRAAGFDVVNPAENGLPAHAEWHQHMRVDIAELMRCDGLVTLPGWEKSRGARLEHDIATRLDMPTASVETVVRFQGWRTCLVCRSQLDEGGRPIVLGDSPMFQVLDDLTDPEWAALVE